MGIYLVQGFLTSSNQFVSPEQLFDTDAFALSPGRSRLTVSIEAPSRSLNVW